MLTQKSKFGHIHEPVPFSSYRHSFSSCIRLTVIRHVLFGLPNRRYRKCFPIIILYLVFVSSIQATSPAYSNCIDFFILITLSYINHIIPCCIISYSFASFFLLKIFCYFVFKRSWDSSVGINVGYTVDGMGSSLGSANIASKLNLQPAQPLPDALSPGVKWPGREASH
jgi:hypothetical protein